MADEAETTPEAPAAGSKRNLLPILLGVGGLLLGVAGGGVGVYLAVGGSDGGSASASDEAGADGGGDIDAKIPDLMGSSEVISLNPPFEVNLRDSAGGRMLMMELAVEASGDAVSLVEDREARIRDAVLILASDYSFAELEGLEGKLRLRDEIQRRINIILEDEKVERVYFTAFLVQ